jgi:hypothetical protein
MTNTNPAKIIEKPASVSMSPRATGRLMSCSVMNGKMIGCPVVNIAIISPPTRRFIPNRITRKARISL